MIKNREIVTLLREIAILYEIKEEKFKSQAYRRASFGVEDTEKELAHIYNKTGIKGLLDVPGVGKNIAKHIEELITTGKLTRYERLKKEIPIDIAGIIKVPGIGPKTIKTLYEKLDIHTVEDLRNAAKAGAISHVAGLKRVELKVLSIYP